MDPKKDTTLEALNVLRRENMKEMVDTFHELEASIAHIVPDTKPNFDRTKAALAAFDADKPRRDALWDAALDNKSFRAADADERAAGDKVREAFWEDTKHVNNRDQAFLIMPNDPWLRALVKKYSP